MFCSSWFAHPVALLVGSKATSSYQVQWQRLVLYVEVNEQVSKAQSSKLKTELYEKYVKVLPDNEFLHSIVLGSTI